MNNAIINALNAIIVTSYTSYNMTLSQEHITIHGLLSHEENNWTEVMVQISYMNNSYNIKEYDPKTAELRDEWFLDSAPKVGDCIHSYSNCL